MRPDMTTVMAVSTPDVAIPVRRRSSRYWMPVRMLAGVVAFLVAGNLLILFAHLWLQRSVPELEVSVQGVKNLAVVDSNLWRGSAPSAAGLRDLADNGVVTVVDLRAERGIKVDEELLKDLRITRYHLPIRDGQAPPAAVVERFLEIVDNSKGLVYVHCGAGVGRTGTMSAAYLVSRGIDPAAAVKMNLAVGPPSLEQVAFAAGLDGGEVNRPAPLVTAVSRLLDAPRRLLVHVRGSYTKH